MSDRETGNEPQFDQQENTIRVNLTADDYAGFNLYHGRWQLAILFVFYWCLLVIAVELSGMAGSSADLAWIIPAAFVVSALLLLYQLWRIKVRTGKLFASDKVAKVQQIVALTEEGIRHTTGETTVLVPWQDVFKLAETSKAVIVYLARSKVVLLPKRDIGNLEAVKSVLRRHLPAAKLRLK